MGLSQSGPAWLFFPADRRALPTGRGPQRIRDPRPRGRLCRRRPARSTRALVDVQLEPARTAVRVNPFVTADQKPSLQP